MNEVEQFMQDFFVIRIAEEKRILAERRGYRQRFFATDCRWDRRTYSLEMLESERIVNIEKSDLEVHVITEYKNSVAPLSARINRRRYSLRAAGDSWQIHDVTTQCPYCRGQGDATCVGCKGSHWLVQ